MIDAVTLPPSADDYAAAARRRRRAALLWTAAVSLLAAGSFVAFGLDNLALPLALLACLLTPVLVWRYPRLALYVTFAAVCLFELLPTGYPDALTDRVPFFANVNTIVQRAGHGGFNAVPLNLFELFILTAAVCSTLRAVFSGTTSLKAGALFWPILAYVAFVGFGWANGMLTGGDFKLSLQEVRAQFYLFIAYLMAVNLVDDKKQVGVLLKTFVVCVGLKGILYTFRRYVTLAGMPLPDQGVGSHEEAFFFDAFAVLLLALLLCGVHKRLQWLMWTLLPFVVMGNLACNRRAATAALAVAVPILLLAAFRALPERRRLVGWIAAVLAVGWGLYYPAFKDSDGMLGQPARAVRSQFSPDARDASSNLYRDAENADLMATIKLSPVQGYGYGKRMLHAVPIADISQQYEWWDVMTHNQILWVWMRVGTLGFVAFWLMVSAILVFACQAIRAPEAAQETKAVGLFVLLVIGMLLIFGLLDLQLVNARDMLFAGLWAGTLASLQTVRQTPAAVGGRP